MKKKYRRHIIWTEKIEDGNKFLEQIIQEYREKGIEAQRTKVHSRYGSEALFENTDGIIDFWRVKRAGDCSRGYRAEFSIVDTRITLEVYNTIIRPQTYSTYYPNNIRYWNPASDWSKGCKYIE